MKNYLKATVATTLFSIISCAQVAADQVILDDLIIDGSACVGLDCVNGESFGFDTIRLKENNLRIKFQDTSTAAAFPSNDWQITINDSANGGANKFSIDDITGGRTPFTIEAGAPSNSLFVDDGGRIGLRTSTPAVELHIVDGDTPTVRLQQDGSSGFTPQTWDLAGNETNFFVRDVTGGSLLPLRIRPGAPTSSIDVAGSGNVGFGTASPSDADGLATRFIDVKTTATNGAVRIVADAASNGFAEFLFQEDNVNKWSFGHAGNANDRLYVFNYTNNREDMTIDDTDGKVSILNGLEVTNGLTVVGGCVGCDAVLTSAWPIESIEEHAARMFEKSYLPGVGPTPEGEIAIDVFQKTTGILQELEIAHIYIVKLNDLVKQLQKRLDEIESK